MAVLVVTAFSAPVAADGISVTQSVDRFNIPFEDSVHFEIVLQWNGPQTAYLFPEPLHPTFERLKVRGLTSSISSSGSGEEEITTKKFRYTLIPTASGIGRIEPVTISYLTWPDSIPGELLTEAMTVQIAEPVPQVEKGTGSFVWGVAAVVTVVGSVVVFVLVWRARRKKPQEIVKTPVAQFLDELTALKQEAGGDLKKFQTGLYKILSGFLTAQYGLNPDGVPDDEVEKLLEPTDLAESQRKQISAWLVQARRDKFRPVVGAPGETIRLEAEIRRCFEQL
jgi:hypothetical protein